MKYLKLLTLCLFPLAFTACHEDPVIVTTGSASVEFAQASMQVKENTTIVEMPIAIVGERHGKVQVTAKIVSNTANFTNENLIVTTEHFIVPEDAETVTLECHLVGVDNEAIEAGRSFTAEITEVKGANLGTTKTCTVNLKENNPLEGTYKLSGLDPFAGAVGSMKVSLSMEEGVTDKAYIDCGFGDMLLMNMEEVVPGVKYNVTIPGGQVVGSNVLCVYGMVNWNTGRVSIGVKDFTGVFENGVITLDTPVDCGIGFYNQATGSLNLYIAYEDNSGTVIPVTLTK